MNLKSRPSYGKIHLSRFVAQRLRKEWSAVESPPLPRRLRVAASALRLF